MPDLLTAFGLIAVVLTVSALASGLVERAPLSFPIIFLGVGFLLGERGFGVISIDPHDRTLETIAVLSLAFVLFLDAVRFGFQEARRDWLVPALALGPGTVLTIALVALAAWLIFNASLVHALMLGAILSSTDPVVLRDVIRDTRIPSSVRRALSLEAGMNDLVVLPVVLVLIAIANAEVGGVPGWTRFLAQLLLLGPLVGAIIGGIGSWLVGQVDARLPIPREYQALYGVGLVLAAFAGGTAVGGDGFLAAFAAGAAVAILNNQLCDCFLEYGEVTAEMTMLLAFVLFGAVLSTLVSTIALVPVLLFALAVLGIARPFAFGLVLLRASISHSARAFLGWFGPRGLNSLLLALLVVQAGVEGSEGLLATAGIVVVVSVVLHGVSATPVSAWYGRRVARETYAEERESSAAGLFEPSPDGAPRITPEELTRRLADADPPLVLDVRSRSEYERDPARIPGSLRVLPDRVREWASEQPGPRAVVTYCT